MNHDKSVLLPLIVELVETVARLGNKDKPVFLNYSLDFGTIACHIYDGGCIDGKMGPRRDFVPINEWNISPDSVGVIEAAARIQRTTKNVIEYFESEAKK